MTFTKYSWEHFIADPNRPKSLLICIALSEKTNLKSGKGYKIRISQFHKTKDKNKNKKENKNGKQDRK